jgi:hypothetical protein
MAVQILVDQAAGRRLIGVGSTQPLMVGLQQKDLFLVIRVAHLLSLVMPVVGLLQEVTMIRIQAVAGVVVQELRERLDQELVQRIVGL